MNDDFVNFDDDRSDRLAEIMQRFSQTRQVIMLSCHRHSRDLCTHREAYQIIIEYGLMSLTKKNSQ